MQHLPLPATRTAHPLGGWHRRGSPSSLHARVVRTSTVEISVQQAISSCPLTALFFQSLKEMDSRTEHYAFWNLFILDYFLIICISELKKICCLLHGLCERRKMLCTPAALRQRLAKWSGRKGQGPLQCWRRLKAQGDRSLVVFPFALVFASDICHQYLEGEKYMSQYK